MSAGTALPQPLEDQAISGEISKIGNLIKNHVHSYYHNRSVNPGLIDLDDIIALGQNLPISTGTISTLLDNTAVREVALRFCIAFAIITRLQNYGNSLESLLPPELCAPMREISDTKYESKSEMLFLLIVSYKANVSSSRYESSPLASHNCRVDASYICSRCIHTLRR